MNKYIDILSSCGADAWEIADTKTCGWEFYFIGHRLDQNRAKDVEHITLKVYKYSEDRESLGIASAEVSPTESDENIRRTVSDLVYKASLVENKPYELNKPVNAPVKSAQLSSLEDEAAAYLSVMDSIRETESEYLNSYEIFVNRHTRRLITSEGIDITEEYQTSVLDLVVNAKNEEHEIELYRLYRLGACDSGLLKKDIEDLLVYGRDRLVTVPTPNLKDISVILSTDAAVSVYQYFLDNMDAAYVVRGMSGFEIGKEIAELTDGDSITLRSARELHGSPSNFTYDSEGALIRDAVIIDHGVPAKYTGNRMFSEYLGIEDSFIISNWSVDGGSLSSAELRTGQFLEIVEFSDFQVDSMTGDIFGEIRLAYYHDGQGHVTPVSGGSVSGSMLDNISTMKLSSETRTYANCRIPCVTRLANVMIAGAE